MEEKKSSLGKTALWLIPLLLLGGVMALNELSRKSGVPSDEIIREATGSLTESDQKARDDRARSKRMKNLVNEWLQSSVKSQEARKSVDELKEQSSGVFKSAIEAMYEKGETVADWSTLGSDFFTQRLASGNTAVEQTDGVLTILNTLIEQADMPSGLTLIAHESNQPMIAEEGSYIVSSLLDLSDTFGPDSPLVILVTQRFKNVENAACETGRQFHIVAAEDMTVGAWATFEIVSENMGAAAFSCTVRIGAASDYITKSFLSDGTSLPGLDDNEKYIFATDVADTKLLIGSYLETIYRLANPT